MQSKSLLIAIAAFAVTATGVHAYSGPQIMNRAGLTKVQKDAIEEAQELRAAGDHGAARDRLMAAGITDEHLRAIHRVASEAREAIHRAILNKDYEAFKVAVVGLPLADIITSEADFAQFCEAHEMRGKRGGVGLGMMSGYAAHQPVTSHTPRLTPFTEAQREALRVARQSNDRATIQAIFDEAGIEYHHHKAR